MNANIASTSSVHQIRWGNTAVDGLIAGSAAGVAMFGYLLVTVGDAPADLLIRFTGAGFEASPLLGAVAHLAVSAIYGMIFALIWRAAKGSSRLVWRLVGGIGYAGLLFIFSEWVLLPAVQSPMLDIPALHWGIGHAVYGIVLGFLYRSK